MVVPPDPGPADPGTTGGDPGTTAPDPGTDYGPVTSTIEGEIVPDGGLPSLASLLNGDIPLGSFTEGVAWSLLNLMMSLISLFTAVVLLISMLFRRKKKEDEEPADALGIEDEEEREFYREENSLRKRLLALRLPAMLLGVLPGILFVVLENIRLPVTWITRWTPIIGAAFLVHMAIVIIHFAVKKKAKKQEDDTDQTNFNQPSKA